MQKQQYSNHRKFYYPHHFIFYPVVITLIVISIKQSLNNPEQKLLWRAIAAVFLLLAWLSFMMRQHYALKIQDRMVRMEMRLRYFRLTGKAFEAVEPKLSFSQMAALRFAPDDELPGLVERALTENLSADEIKRAVKNWLPDLMRV